jgi:ribose/xylose/arabinose/galactoside ABC-type transport system permease subunit
VSRMEDRVTWRSRDSDASWVGAASAALIGSCALLFTIIRPDIPVGPTLKLMIINGGPFVLLTVAQMLLLRAGRLEPACLGIANLSGVLFALMIGPHDVPFFLAWAVSIVVAVPLFGIVNGLLASALSLPATVGISFGLFFGLDILANSLIGEQLVISLPLETSRLVYGSPIFGIPLWTVMCWVGTAAIGAVVLARNSWWSAPRGRSQMIIVYCVAGLVSAAGGIAQVAHDQAASVTASQNWLEAMIITAMLVGGASLYGGRGSVLGCLIGSAMVIVIRTTIGLKDLPNQMDLNVAICGLIAAGLFLVDHYLRDRIPLRIT